MAEIIKIMIHVNDDGAVTKCVVKGPDGLGVEPLPDVSGAPESPVLTIDYGVMKPISPKGSKKTAKSAAGTRRALALDPRCKYVKMLNQWYLMCPTGVRC